MSLHFVVKGLQTKTFLEVPFGSLVTPLLTAFALGGVFSWANSKMFVTPESCKPEFLAEQAKIGNVIARTEVPAVFINPIMNGIPGNVLGPDDLE